MSKHLEFIEIVSGKPVYVLKKDMVASKGGKNNSMLSELLDCYITDITDEKIFVNGMEHRIKRVFVKSADSGDYSGVGWVVNSEISYCMVCSIAFGMFTYQHHCKACGNVVCHSCSCNNAIIFELKSQGPLRVCNQCDWGQEVIYAVPQKSISPPTIPSLIQTNRRSVTIEKPIVEVVSLPAEDPEKVLKMQQQAEFQRQAIARLSQGKLVKKASVSMPLSSSSRDDGDHSPAASSTPRQPLSRINSMSGNTGILGGAPVTANPMRAASVAASSPPPAAQNASPVRNGSVATTVSPMRNNSTLVRNNTSSVTPPVAPASDFRASSSEELADQQHAQRLHKMLSFGPLVMHSPTPAFVMKTKRNDLTKIFVNVCTHGTIPYKAEEPPSSSGGEAYDMSKTVYMLVGQPLEYQNEKDKSYCVIYDIVVHPDEVYVCSIDSTGIARNRLCSQALDLIAIHYLEALDPLYKILKISSNYKGKSESAVAKVKTAPIAIPHKDAFYALGQMATHTADVEAPSPSSSTKEVSPRDSEKAANRSSITTSKQNGGRHSITAASAAAVMALQEANNGEGSGKNARSSVSFISAGENSRSSIVMDSDRTTALEKNDSVRSNLDQALKVTVKPAALAAKASNNNFNNVLEDLKMFQYNFRDIVITPEAGFVISAQRVNRGQQIFVNVCHHPLVAMLSVKAAADKGRSLAFDQYPSSTPCPYVIGAIDNDFLCTDGSLLATPSRSSISGAGGIKSIVIDVVIPSSVMLVIIQDSTGDLRDKLAIDMLENVSKLNVQFDGNFTLPLVAGGYVGKSPQIFPVINQTEEEKKEFVVSFVGKFSKQGHGVKSWKERLVQVVDSKLKYFDLNSNYKGDFNIDDCSVSYVTNAECSAPTDTYPFKMSNFVTGGEFMYCHVTNHDLRELFSLVIITKARQLSVAKDLITIPDLTTGWLKKQGHMVKNWKKRFFVLSYGVVKYYEKNGQEGRGSGENELGSVDLKGGTVKVVVNSEISAKSGSGKDCRLSIVQSSGKDLLVEAESLVEKNAWFDALKKHIIYANQYN